MNRILCLLILISSCKIIPKSAEDALFKEGENSSASPAVAVTPTVNWDFSTAGDYTYDTNFISVTAGKATLLPLDQTYDSSAEFTSGTLLGTEYSSSTLSLGSGGGCNSSFTNCEELSADWTPQYASIVAYWQMNNNWNDSVGGFHGTPMGGPSFTSSSKMGSHSGFFDGVDDRVYVATDPFNPGTGNFSFSAWVRSTKDYPTNAHILSMRGTSPNLAYLMYVSNETVTFQIRDTDADLCNATSNALATETVADGNLHHLVGVRSGTNCLIYLDGELVGSQNQPLLGNIDLSGATGTCIGHQENGCTTSSGENAEGLIDEVAIWSTDLTSAEIKHIYLRQRSKYAGSYQSATMDLGSVGTWTDISWVTSLPFGKELPGSSGNELSSSYSGLVDSTGVIGNSNLANGLVGLWHFNEKVANSAPGTTDFADSSGNGNHCGETGTATYGVLGVFDVGFNPNNSGSSIDCGSSSSLEFSTTFSTSFWTKILIYQDNDIFINREGEYEIGIDGVGGIKYALANTTPGWAWVGSGHILRRNVWEHVTFTFDSTLGSNNVKLYVNGALVHQATTTGSLGDISGLNDHFHIGGRELGGFPIMAFMDELGMWNRALHPSEVLELYRRGANKVNFQVRSCDDAACAGETWIGPDGTANTYFTELENCSSINGVTGVCNGTIQSTGASLTFSDFVAAPIANRYFQFRTYLESNDQIGVCSGSTPCMPDVSSIGIGPVRYPTSSPTITNSTTNSFNNLFSITSITGGACTPTYQLSNDNITYYYWNGVAWVAAGGVGQSNNATVVETNISSFVGNVGTGSLYWRAYLTSDGTQACELDNLEFVFD